MRHVQTCLGEGAPAPAGRAGQGQVERALGDETLRELAQALTDLGGEALAARLDAFLTARDRENALAAALEQADECAQQRLQGLGRGDLAGLVRDLPLRGLPSVLEALRNLPADDLMETRLQTTLREVWARDAQLTAEQAEAVAEVYLRCLREALLEVETDALRELGRAVLRTEEAVARMERAIAAWAQKERRRLDIHGPVSHSAIVQGDFNTVIQYFVAPVRRLPTDYGALIEAFLTAYLGTPEKPVPFGGRDDALADLDAWLKDPDTPYLLLTAPAGMGKSALLVRWLARLRQERPDLPTVFVPVSIRYGTHLSTVTFAALAAQLARIYGEEVPTDPNTPAAVWKGICATYLRREPPQGRLLVLVDGLDEAADWDVDAGLFPQNPPPGLKVAVSARLTADREHPEDWRYALGWERLPVREMSLAPLTRTGLRDVLEKMGVPLDELARWPFIVEELHRLTQGDPLLTHFYVEDLWGKGEEALRLKPEDLRNLEPGYQGYIKRWWEDQRRLWGNDAPLKERAVQETLNLLAAALGSLPREALLDLADPEAGLNSWTLEEALRPLARFVMHTPEGYVFGHPKLGEFFFGRLTRRERRNLEARFLAWGKAALQALASGEMAPKDAPAYVVRYYRAHLERAVAPLDDLAALVHTRAWAEAWEALQGSYAGYLNDVWAVWRRAMDENQRALSAFRPSAHSPSAMSCPAKR